MAKSKNKNKTRVKSAKFVPVKGKNRGKAKKSLDIRPAKIKPVLNNKNTKMITQPKGKTEAIKKNLKQVVDDKKVQKAKMTSMPSKDDVRKTIDALIANDEAMNYLKKNVSRRTTEVIEMLDIPRTDEYIAAELDTKVNTIRRILNIMNGYGLANYYISKNANGWLSFEWYINVNKVQQFFDYIKEINSDKLVINNECDDYFVCDDCYDKYKLVFVFESAFELGFKCSCGKKLTRLDREGAERLINESRITANNQEKLRESMQVSQEELGIKKM